MSPISAPKSRKLVLARESVRRLTGLRDNAMATVTVDTTVGPTVGPTNEIDNCTCFCRQ